MRTSSSNVFCDTKYLCSSRARLQQSVRYLNAGKQEKMKPRRQSLFLTASDSSAGVPPTVSKKSLMKFLQPKPRKKKSGPVDTIAKDRSLVGRSPSPIPTESLMEQKCEYTRVVATVLHPEIYYKTLPITQQTTAYDVIVAVIEKYAISMEDQNPDCFFLTETKESEQGSYSRFLEHYEKVHSIQSRWTDGKNCCFTLCRVPKISRESLLLDVPLSPVGVAIISNSQDSCFSYSAFVEEGYSPTSSEFMSDSYFSVTSDGSSSTSKPMSVCIESPQAITPPTFGFPESALESPKFIPHGNSRRIKSVRAKTNSNGIIRRSSPLEDSVFALSNLELMPSQGGETYLGGSESGYNSEENRPKQQKEGCASRRNMSLLMQQSIDEGMSGIMRRVVAERRQSAPNQPPKPYAVTSPVSGSGVPKLRPLVCSPTQSAERKYPEFVFTPVQKSIDESSTKPQTDTFHQENEITSLENSAGAEIGSDRNANTAQDPGMSRDHSNYYSQGISSSIKWLRVSSSDSCLPSYTFCQEQVTDYLPYNHRKTSRATPSVLFETELIVFPQFQTSAGLYPSFICSDHFSSEMDMFESLSTLMEIKFSGTKNNGQDDTDNHAAHKHHIQDVFSNSTWPSIESLALSPRKVSPGAADASDLTVSALISSARRSRLIDQAAKAIKLKRAHSFNLDQDRNTRQDIHPVHLISSARRAHLVQQAAWAIKRRRSSQPCSKEELDAASHEVNRAVDIITRRSNQAITPMLRKVTSSNNMVTQQPLSAQVESSTVHEQAVVQENTTGCDITNEPVECTDLNGHIKQHPRPNTMMDSFTSSMSTSNSNQGSLETMATAQLDGNLPRTQSDVHSVKSSSESLDAHNHTIPTNISMLSIGEAAGNTKRKLSFELSDPKLSKSFLETSRSYKSMEKLAGVNGEILYTSSTKSRPMTLVVSNKQLPQPVSRIPSRHISDSVLCIPNQ